jgi:hypothetical protein
MHKRSASTDIAPCAKNPKPDDARGTFGFFSVLPLEIVEEILFMLLNNGGGTAPLNLVDCYNFFTTCKSAAALKEGWFTRTANRMRVTSFWGTKAEVSLRKLVSARHSLYAAVRLQTQFQMLTRFPSPQTQEIHNLEDFIWHFRESAQDFQLQRSKRLLYNHSKQCIQSLVASTMTTLIRFQPHMVDILWNDAHAPGKPVKSAWFFYIQNYHNVDETNWEDPGGGDVFITDFLRPVQAVIRSLNSLLHYCSHRHPVILCDIARDLWLHRSELHRMVIPTFFAGVLTAAGRDVQGDVSMLVLEQAAKMGVQLDLSDVMTVFTDPDSNEDDDDGLHLEEIDDPDGPAGIRQFPRLYARESLTDHHFRALLKLVVQPPDVVFTTVIPHFLHKAMFDESWETHPHALRLFLRLFEPSWGLRAWSDICPEHVTHLFPDVIEKDTRGRAKSAFQSFRNKGWDCDDNNCPKDSCIPWDTECTEHWLVSRFVLDTGIPELIALPRTVGETHSALLHNFPPMAMHHPNAALMPVPSLSTMRQVRYFDLLLDWPQDMQFMLEWLQARGVAFGGSELQELRRKHPDIAAQVSHLFILNL